MTNKFKTQVLVVYNHHGLGRVVRFVYVDPNIKPQLTFCYFPTDQHLPLDQQLQSILVANNIGDLVVDIKPSNDHTFDDPQGNCMMYDITYKINH